MDPQVRRPPTPQGLPLIGNTLDFVRGPFELVDKAIRECGDIYRIKFPGNEIYVLAHPEYFRRALVTDSDVFGKTLDFQRAFGNGLLSTEGSQWSRQRGILQPLFGLDRIKDYGDSMVAATQRRLTTWEEGETIEMESEMQDLTLEILFSTLFGRELSPGEGDELRAASDGLNKWFNSTSWALPHWVPTLARREFSNSVERLRMEIRQLLSEHSVDSASEYQSDLLSKLQEALEASGQNHLSMEEVEGQMVTMIFAGYETTAAALGFAWYSLATNPDIQQAFHEEIDTVLGGDCPTYDNIDDLGLTQRIVTETLRLYPPVHTIPRRSTQDIEINDYLIPSDEEVHLSIIAVHRDERFYDDPMTFRPDRWTDNFEEELPEYAFVPFGGGRRTCIGREFARLEATLVLATIGQQWELVWDGGDTALTMEPEITIKTKNGLPIQVQAR